MHVIDSTAAMVCALDRSIDDDLLRLLALRRDQLLEGSDADLADLAQFIVVEPGDAVAAIEAAAGYPLVSCNSFEWVQRHGRYLEAAAVLSDDGFAVVLVVADDEGADPTLLALLREEAGEPAATTAPPGEAGRATAP